MANSELEDNDPEISEWVRLRNKAKAKQEAAHAGFPVPTVAEHDIERARQAQAQIAATRAASVTPGSLNGSEKMPWDMSDEDLTTQAASPVIESEPRKTPSATTGSVTQAPVQILDICVWECRVSNDEKTVTIFAPNWEVLKGKLKPFGGNWTATEHKFSNTIENILGFFTPEQYPTPKNSAKKTFDIIVQNGKVFKGEP